MKIYHYKNLGHNIYYEYIDENHYSNLNIGKVLLVNKGNCVFTIGLEYNFDKFYSKLVSEQEFNKIMVFQ